MNTAFGIGGAGGNAFDYAEIAASLTADLRTATVHVGEATRAATDFGGGYAQALSRAANAFRAAIEDVPTAPPAGVVPTNAAFRPHAEALADMARHGHTAATTFRAQQLPALSAMIASVIEAHGVGPGERHAYTPRTS